MKKDFITVLPDSDATRLEIRIGVGRGDIGIDENQVWVRYHFDLT